MSASHLRRRRMGHKHHGGHHLNNSKLSLPSDTRKNMPVWIADGEWIREMAILNHMKIVEFVHQIVENEKWRRKLRSIVSSSKKE